LLSKDGAVLSAVPLSSFAGIVLGLVNWLFNGSALVLHHPFDAEAFAEQCRAQRCATLALPGPVVPALADARLLSEDDGLRRVVALWRSTSQWRSARRWEHRTMQLVDMLALGEFAVSVSPRDSDGIPDPAVLTTAGADERPTLALARSRDDTLALRGAMVPSAPFPPGAAAAFALDGDGFLDTGLPLRPGDDTAMAIRLDQRPGLARVGGYPLRIADIEKQVAAVDPFATIAVLPHGLTGSRLVGASAHPAALVEALASVNPLVGTAFVPRRTLP
jgi:acyl-CoA synthetase (AMP-forming)/AMP-acid ligase II